MNNEMYNNENNNINNTTLNNSDSNVNMNDVTVEENSSEVVVEQASESVMETNNSESTINNSFGNTNNKGNNNTIPILVVAFIIVVSIIGFFAVKVVQVNDLVNNKYANIGEIQKINSTYGEAYEYSKDKTLDKLIDEIKEYEIHSDNYHVVYTLPGFMEQPEYNTNYGYYSYYDDDKNISVSVDVKKCYDNTLSDIDGLMDVFDDYTISRLDAKIKSEEIKQIDDSTYIYRALYSEKRSSGDNNNELVNILRKIDDDTAVNIKLLFENTSITKKFMDSISIENIEKYDEYLLENRNDETTSFALKKKSNLVGNYQVDFVIPSKYVQIDKSDNLYSTRYFNYDEENVMVENGLGDISVDSQKRNVEFCKDNGKYKPLTLNKELSKDNYKVYEANYNKRNNDDLEYLVFIQIGDEDRNVNVIVTSDNKIDAVRVVNDFQNVKFSRLVVGK